MVTTGQSLEGTYEHKLDTKYRVAVPVHWRPAPGQTVQLRLLRWKFSKVPVLRAMRQEAFDAMLQSIAEDSEIPIGVRSLHQQAVRAESKEVTLNEQGKLTVPKADAHEYGFEGGGAVHLFGRGNAFDLVAPDRLPEIKKAHEELMERVYAQSSMGFGQGRE